VRYPEFVQACGPGIEITTLRNKKLQMI